jgi:hypothetical protein
MAGRAGEGKRAAGSRKESGVEPPHSTGKAKNKRKESGVEPPHAAGADQSRGSASTGSTSVAFTVRIACRRIAP